MNLDHGSEGLARSTIREYPCDPWFGIMAHSRTLSLHVLFPLFALLAVLITDTGGLVHLIGLRRRLNGICLRMA